MKIFVFANEINPRIQRCLSRRQFIVFRDCYIGGFILKTFLSHHYIYILKYIVQNLSEKRRIVPYHSIKDATDGITCIVQIKNERCMDY